MNLKRAFGLIIFICPQLLFSQTAPSYSIYTTNSITLRSDVNSKSALLTNISTSLVGDHSPVLGVAAWQDSGKQFECRSIIEFDLRELPNFIKQVPDRVENAELILYPKPGEEKNTDPCTFFIHRVWEPWTDSLTTWDQKPIVNSADRVKVKIDPDRKRAVRIDVTKMVISMLKFGNYGFMFSRQDPIAPADKGDWFASAKNNDKKARPVLIVSYTGIIQENNNNNLRTESRQHQRQNPPATPTPPRTGGN